jgi:hypothetical protein
MRLAGGSGGACRCTHHHATHFCFVFHLGAWERSLPPPLCPAGVFTTRWAHSCVLSQDLAGAYDEFGNFIGELPSDSDSGEVRQQCLFGNVPPPPPPPPLSLCATVDDWDGSIDPLFAPSPPLPSRGVHSLGRRRSSRRRRSRSGPRLLQVPVPPPAVPPAPSSSPVRVDRTRARLAQRHA